MDYKIINYRDDDIDKIDNFSSKKLANKLKLQIEASYDKYSVIGLFGGYGEGKSSIIDIVREKLSKGILDIDAWKYDIKDIENALHRIYNLETDMKSISGNVKQIGLNVLNRFKKGIIKKYGFDASLASGLSKDYEFYQYNLHREAFKTIKLSLKRAIKYDEPIGVICFENLDRCSTEKKIEILASIHKLQDWFDMPILVAIDPFAVDKQKKYFEDLVKKVFYTSFYIEQKTAIQIDKYMQSKVEIDPILQNYLNTIYPITPRDINYILNIYRAKHKEINSKNAKCSYALMAILHSEYRELYHEISMNPFMLNHYISLAQQNPLCNSFEALKYSDKDALMINRLLLYFYRDIDDFSIYDVFGFLSPSMKLLEDNIMALNDKNILDIKLEDLKDIISLLLQSYNYYEVKEMIKKCSYIEDKDKIEVHVKFILLEAFQYKNIIEIMFIDESYLNVIKSIKFEDYDIKAILNMCANSFGEQQNMHLAKFILSLIDKDKVSSFKKEFAMIFTQHNHLFLAFCQEIKEEEKLSGFIYDIMCDELYDSILSIETSKALDFYGYFLAIIPYIKINKGDSDKIYRKYIFRIFDSILTNKILFFQIVTNNLFFKYSILLSKLESTIAFTKFSRLIQLLNTPTIPPLDKLRVYYQIINKTDNKEAIDEVVFEDFVYLIVEIVLENQEEENTTYSSDIIDILCDNSFILLDNFVRYKDKIAKIMMKIISQSNETKAYDKFSRNIPKVIFTYVKEEDFETLYHQFKVNDFGLNLFKYSNKNRNFFKFLAFLADNNYLEPWLKIDKEKTQTLLIELANSENKIAYIDKKTKNEQIFETLDFKIFSLKKIKKHIDISEEKLYIFMKEFDAFIENGVLDFNTWLKENSDEDEIKSKLIEDRLYFAFMDNKEEHINSIYDEIFGLYLEEEYSDTFYPLVDRLQKYIREFGIESENVKRVLEEW